MRKFLYATFVGVSLLLASCGGSRTESVAGGGDTVVFKYAKGITMVRLENYTVVHLRNPWKPDQTLHTYILVPKSAKQLPAHLPEGDVIRIPVTRSVVFTTAHCQLLEELGVARAISGVCDLKYMLIPDIQRRARMAPDSLRSAQLTPIVDCGEATAPMVEKIIDLKPEIIVASPFENSGGYGKLDALGIPIVEVADYMETSALGRAEWMRFYGLLFGREKLADALFHRVDSTYQSLRKMAIKLPLGRSILTERKTGSVWYCPGGQSSIGQMIADAHGRYVFAHDRHSGSLSLNFETVLDKAGDVDVWAFKYDGSHPLSKTELLQEYAGYAELKAFRTGEIYECDCSTLPYFEQVPFHPEYLLRDLIQLLHPGVNLGELRYYRKLE